MPDSFADYTFDDALKVIKDLEDAEAKSALLYKDGDHWQEGTQWVGPPDLDVVGRGLILKMKIKPIFVSKNIIKEGVEGHRDAVIGREPRSGYTVRRALGKVLNAETGKFENEKPNEVEQELIKSAGALLTEWWDANNILSVFQEATDMMLTTEHGLLRFVIPSGFLDENQKVKPADLPTWLSRLRLKSHPYDEATVYTDEDTQRQASFFKSERDGKMRVEISFVDDNDKTALRILEEKAQPNDATPYDLGGKLFMFEMRRTPLVTPQVKQNNALYNTTATMRCRNIGTAGWPETTYENTKRPSHFEDDPNNPGEKMEVFDKTQSGPGARMYTSGHPIYSEDGKRIIDYTNSSVSYRDPVNVKTFEQTEQSAYRSILQEFRQIHRLLTGDGSASAVSRIQARADFVASLRPTKSQIDAAGRWVLETVLALAADLAGVPNPYVELRADFDCRLDPGPLTPEERQAIITEVSNDPPLRSIEDAMTLLGIEDTEAMLAQIESERNRLNPRAGIDVERARLALENDKRNGDTGIPSRIEEAAKEKETVIN
jgi:hypothetical protein